jgi:hypothetical protein
MSDEAAIPVKKDAKPATRKSVAKAPEINYDKLAEMVAAKMAPMFMNAAPKETQSDDFSKTSAQSMILDDGSLAIGGVSVEAITEAVNGNYLNELAFMEEMLEVVVHGTTDKNAENPVRVGVNGVEVLFFRDKRTRCRRKFVNGLIVKQDEITTPKTRNGAGEDTYGIIKQANAKFPFAISHDPSPYGPQWLAQRMAEIQ